MAHECIIRVDLDQFAYTDQYLVQCRCHMDSYRTWRPGDRPIVCPVSSTDLTAGLTDGKEVGGS